MDDLNSSNFLNTAPLRSSFKASDREQAQIRLVIPMLALLWAARNPVGTGAFCFWGFEPHFAMAGLYFLVGVAIFFIWRSVYKHLPQHAGLLRKICLFSDISAISAYSAVSDSASIVLLPIYLSAIIGYGMRFGKRYLVTALLLGLTQFLFVIHLNPYLSMNSPIVTTYVISMAFVPIYTLVLLQKYSLVFAAYISTSRDLEHFIDVMSHEIRAPLQSIISLGELCQARLRKLLPISPLIPSLHMNMLDISRCAERMLAVANRITAQRKLANATQRSQQAYFNTFRDIFLAIRVCTVIAARKRLQFQWYVDSNTPCLTNIDSSSLQAVLINLIDNSIKNTSSGSVRVSVDAKCTSAATGELLISVTDTGPGIPTVIDNGDRASRNRESLIARNSAGLGLEIVKRNVATLLGTLEHQPSQPKGTRFTVRLPYTFNKYDFQTEISWICIALISDRSLSESEESLLIKSKLFPKFLPLRSANTESAAFGSVQFCACLADQCETLESLITKPEWQRFSTLPLVILRDSARTEPNPDTSTANFEIEIGDREKAISQLNQVRMFTCADFFSESTQPKTTKGSGSVLLIDDSELTLEALQRLLEASGYECTVAATIDSALDVLRHSPFDIIVADRFVGEFDFMEVLRRERIGIRYHVPILILSADSDTSKATDIAELAIDKVLTKPVSSIQLLDAVAQLIDKHMPERKSDSDLTVASSIDWELLDELIGFTADPEHARQVLQKFEDEILSDCVRCLGYLFDRHFAELAALLHRMSGAALLFGARGLSDVLEGVRCGAIGGYIEAQAIEAIQGLDSILCEFLRECRNRYSF